MAGDDTSKFAIEIETSGGDARRLTDGLALALEIGEADARRILSQTPAVVRTGVDQQTTKKLARQLIRGGFSVKVRNEGTGEIKTYSGLAVAALTSAVQGPDTTRASRPSLPSLPGVSQPPPPAAPARSIPPPASPSSPPPPSMRPGAVEACGGCGRKLEKGPRCRSCGWTNASGTRSCPGCGGDLAPSALPPRLAAVPAALAVAAGVVGLVSRSWHWAGVAVLGALALSFAGSGLLQRLRCVSCHLAIDPAYLRDPERRRLLAARGTRFGLAAALALGAATLVALAPARPALFIDSFGMGWSAPLPWSASDLRRERSAAPVDGARWATVVQRASGDGAVHTYVLAQVPSPAEPGSPALVQRAIEQTVPGARVEVTESARPHAGMPTWDATITLDPSRGRARAVRFPGDLVVLIALSADPDGGGETAARFLDSLVVHDRE